MPPFPYRVAALLAGLACASSPAAAQMSANVIFQANLDDHAGYSDVWGYTAPNGDEYALLGTWNGLSVINVADPAAPYETGFLTGQFSTWRDIKTYQHWAYVTNESGGGLAIVDLADPENPVSRPAYAGFNRAHNLYIEESTGRCYIAGSDLERGGVRILSLANPEVPVEIGSWEVDYVHDVIAQSGRMYCSAIYAGRLAILDVTNPGSIPPLLGAVQGYPGAFTHNAWITADDTFVMTTDEVAGAAIRMWDITDPAAPTQTDLYQPNPGGAPHNVVIDGDRAFVAHYTAGVRVVDISDPNSLGELGFYDTYPANDGATFDGCWGVFPFFGTTPGLFVASDIETGLYVLEYRGPLGTVKGRVTESGSPGVGVAGARVEVLETGVAVLTDGLGDYVLKDTGGAVTLRVEAFGYAAATLGVAITAGSTLTQDVPLSRLAGGSISGLVYDAQTALPVPGALVEVRGTPLTGVSDGAGNYAHTAIPTGSYTVAASAFGYDTQLVRIVTSFGTSDSVDFGLEPALAAASFEAPDPGWTVTGGALTGRWERADPQQTTEGSQAVQSEDDHTVAGVNAWVTGPLAGAAVGQWDVDGGETVLSSPVYDLTALAFPRVSYWRWYSTGIGNPSTDRWSVDVSSDAGASWVVLEALDQPRAQWSQVDVALDSLIVPSSAVVFRFTARDTGTGSITEAAVDDFMVYDTRGATGTSVAAGGAPREMLLSQAYPNPVRGGQAVHLSLALPHPGRVEATVFDVAGRRVAVLTRGRMPAGPHRIGWDARLPGGPAAPAGVYFIRLESDAGSFARKVVVLR
jgi:choice-of-anchor B domain-containing protein